METQLQLVLVAFIVNFGLSSVQPRVQSTDQTDRSDLRDVDFHSFFTAIANNANEERDHRRELMKKYVEVERQIYDFKKEKLQTARHRRTDNMGNFIKKLEIAKRQINRSEPGEYAREEMIDKLEVDSELKHIYQSTDSIDQRSQIYDNVIDLFFTYFYALEKRLRDDVKNRFEYSTINGPEVSAYKEEITTKFTDCLDKYIEVSLKHKLYAKDLTEFRKTFNRDEQMKFFRDYHHAYNYTKILKNLDLRPPKYTPWNISELIYG